VAAPAATALTTGEIIVIRTEMHRGKMLWFNEEKNHGFIATDEGERLYVHGTGFEGGTGLEGPCAGIVVEFMIEEGTDGRHAQRVRVVPDVAPRRARRRGSR
jgi:CspA family cold shock protein